MSDERVEEIRHIRERFANRPNHVIHVVLTALAQAEREKDMLKTLLSEARAALEGR